MGLDICRRSYRSFYKVVNKGKLGETYNIGNNEKTNIEVVNVI